VYISERDNIDSLLDTIKEAVELVKISPERAKEYINESAIALDTIKTYLEENAPECDTSLIKDSIILFDKCAKEKDISESDKIIKQCINNINMIKAAFFSEVKTRWKALFIPYKAAMWTSLESIWQAASNDPNCDAIVMPIPYYNVDKHGNKRKLNYEGELFPDYVPIVHYIDYNISEEQPEMIYFHNPYDELNALTRVPEQYYSKNLKQHTKCLVYSPYFTFGRYYPNKSDFQFNTIGTYNADKIIIQSDSVNQIFEEFNHPSKCLMTVGSPKIDAIVNMNKKNIELPKQWEDKINGKKVFLLNTHIYYFSKSKDYAIKSHKEILEAFTRRTDCALIWRPHPLMKSTVKSRFDEYIEFIEKMEKTIDESDNCIIDNTLDYTVAFKFSDALISSYSSLINEYMVTGKPVLIYQKKPSKEAVKNFPVDYLYNYYRYKPDLIFYDRFIDMVISGEDPLYEGRMEMLKYAFANIDGTAGEKAYEEIVKEISSKK
jgi:hypothetical protein